MVAYTRIPSAFRHLGSRRSGQSQGSTFLAFLGRDPSLISRVGLYQVPLVVFKLFGPPIATPKVAISILLTSTITGVRTVPDLEAPQNV